MASALLRRVPQWPWQYTATDYRAAMVLADPHGSPHRLTDAPWDAWLSGALLERGIRVEEGTVLDTRLTDPA
ncbi:DUF2399 domain-containing protein [Streptomyces sp. NPDC098090]|uniref:DUF2399 domain-containing protein n=1 Tax=Streptomyces sp. NPDC098090 TaxID=3366095 RepID=UPI00380E3A34